MPTASRPLILWPTWPALEKAITELGRDKNHLFNLGKNKQSRNRSDGVEFFATLEPQSLTALSLLVADHTPSSFLKEPRVLFLLKHAIVSIEVCATLQTEQLEYL
jgi:hypothetical protein